MEVILLERIERLGQMGEVVTVKPGYARNFLLPQRKALRATKTNLAEFENRRAELETVNENKRKEAEGDVGKLEGLSLVLIRSAGESGQLYGSVSAADVARSLAEQDIAIERRQVELAAPIKALGLHTARIRLHPEVAVEITLNVAQSEDEAKANAAAVPAAPEAEQAAETAAAAPQSAAEAAEEVAGAGVSEEAAEEFFEEPAAAGPEEAAGEAEAAPGGDAGEAEKDGAGKD